MTKKSIILGIETSCDETAVALVQDTGNDIPKILSNVVSSQFDIHREFGGVVPELAARSHVEKINLIADEARKILPNDSYSAKMYDFIFTSYKNNSDSNYSNYDRLSIVRQEVASDLIDKYVGIADANYADGATATVLCAGNVSDKHSSLSPGSKYYVSATGTLSTAKANPEVFAGTAVSATTITVKN